MVINTAEFKKVCATILAATDGSELSTLTETLELKTVHNVLYLSTTNKEYYVRVSFPLDHEEAFHAAVNANLFLKLIAAITSDTIELTIQGTVLHIKANGNYKLPIITENDTVLEVPVINIENKTLEMTVSSSVLDSIVTHNSKQLAIGSVAKPVQKMFYIDHQGCLTFTTGACVNTFELEKPFALLLNSRLVNLFKLFKNAVVKFSLGYDPISETIIQTKVSFETDTITLTAITGCDDTLLSQVPVEAIRARANKAYDNVVVLNVTAVTEAINRLLLFSAGYGSKENLKPYSVFEFGADKVVIYDTKKENTEVLAYQNGTRFTGDYLMTLDLIDFKKVLDSCTEQYVTLIFGDHKACVVARGAIKNVLPEVITKAV